MPWAAVDPGASRNACAIAAIDRTPAGLWAPVYLAEEQGEKGRPLDVRNVLPAHAVALRHLGCESWMTDGWSHHDVLHGGAEGGLCTLVVGGTLWEQWRHLMAVAARDQLWLGPHARLPRDQWHMLDRLVEQLGTVVEKFANGERSIVIPEVGTSHGDLAAAFARCFLHARAADLEPPRSEEKFNPKLYGTPSRYAATRR